MQGERTPPKPEKERSTDHHCRGYLVAARQARQTDHSTNSHGCDTPGCLELRRRSPRRLRDLQGMVDLYAEIAHGRLQLRVPEQQLHERRRFFVRL